MRVIRLSAIPEEDVLKYSPKLRHFFNSIRFMCTGRNVFCANVRCKERAVRSIYCRKCQARKKKAVTKNNAFYKRASRAVEKAFLSRVVQMEMKKTKGHQIRTEFGRRVFICSACLKLKNKYNKIPAAADCAFCETVQHQFAVAYVRYSNYRSVYGKDLGLPLMRLVQKTNKIRSTLKEVEKNG